MTQHQKSSSLHNHYGKLNHKCTNSKHSRYKEDQRANSPFLGKFIYWNENFISSYVDVTKADWIVWDLSARKDNKVCQKICTLLKGPKYVTIWMPITPENMKVSMQAYIFSRIIIWLLKFASCLQSTLDISSEIWRQICELKKGRFGWMVLVVWLMCIFRFLKWKIFKKNIQIFWLLVRDFWTLYL